MVRSLGLQSQYTVFTGEELRSPLEMPLRRVVDEELLVDGVHERRHQRGEQGGRRVDRVDVVRAETDEFAQVLESVGRGGVERGLERGPYPGSRFCRPLPRRESGDAIPALSGPASL